MARLSFLDTAFLILESRKTPMHIGGLFVLEPPKQQHNDFAGELYAELLADPKVVAPYDQRVRYSLTGLPEWVPVPQVDLRYHVRLHCLPKPGQNSQLLELVSQLQSPVMDHSRPLWECHVIDGLADHRVGLFIRIHHSMADGAKANHVVRQFFSLTPRKDPLLPFWQQASTKRPRPAAERDLIDKVLDPVSAALKQAATLPSLAKMAGKMAFGVVDASASRLPIPFTAQRTPFNRYPEQARQLAVGTFPLARFKRLGRLTGATVNDIMLTLCDIALTRYLAEQDFTLTKPLIALMPVNLKRDAASADNNFSPALVELGCNLALPADRLAAIMASSRNVKDEALSMSAGAFYNYSIAINAVSLLGGMLKLNKLLAPASNMIISNVPGPREPLFLKEARVAEIYPVSVLLPAQTLNVTLYSYAGQAHFGLTYCRSSLPQFESISDFIEEAMVDLEADVMDRAVAAVNHQLQLFESADGKDKVAETLDKLSE